MAVPTIRAHTLIACLICSTVWTHSRAGSTQPSNAQKLEALTTSQKEKPKTVYLKNTINKKDLGVKRMLKKHYPKYFRLKVNGQKVEQNQAVEVVAGTPVTVAYEYEWYIPWGNKIASKQASFALSPQTEHADISFKGWDASERIAINKAKKVEGERENKNITLTFSQDDVY